jgi:hypothetical protein
MSVDDCVIVPSNSRNRRRFSSDISTSTMPMPR